VEHRSICSFDKEETRQSVEEDEEEAKEAGSGEERGGGEMRREDEIERKRERERERERERGGGQIEQEERRSEVQLRSSDIGSRCRITYKTLVRLTARSPSWPGMHNRSTVYAIASLDRAGIEASNARQDPRHEKHASGSNGDETKIKRRIDINRR